MTAGQDNPPRYVRETVRAILLSSPAYHELGAEQQRALAMAMVRVCQTAASLLREEMESEAQIRTGTETNGLNTPATSASLREMVNPGHRLPPAAPMLAEAQAARGRRRGQSAASGGPPMASQVGTVARQILNAVSFPRFVTELINGVFKAMVDSSIQQMTAFVDLLNNVAASTEGFADANMSTDQARAWLAERYPDAFEVAGSEDGDGEAGERTLRLREGARMPSAEALRTSLGLRESDPTPAGDPERSLLPLARRAMARNRQQVLASMVMLGMQRIVIESGRIHASMRLHIDTRDAQNSDSGSMFSLQNRVTASAEVGIGIWGASASIQNNIAYVNTQRSQTTAEMNTDLELTSSVDIQFKSDYLPLNRLASPGQVQQIQANTRNPDAEVEAARTARREQAHTSERARAEGINRTLAPPPAMEPLREGERGTPEHAASMRQRGDQQQGGGAGGGAGGEGSGEGGGEGGGSSGSSGNSSDGSPGTGSSRGRAEQGGSPAREAGGRTAQNPGAGDGNQEAG